MTQSKVGLVPKSPKGGNTTKAAKKKRTCRKCHGAGTITSTKTGTTVDCDCVRS